MIKSVWGFDFIHPLLRSIWLQVYQEPSSTRWVKEIFRWHAKDFTINKIQTSKQPFPRQTQRRHQTHKKGNQATHCRWQNNELLQTRTISIQQSTRTKYHTVPQIAQPNTTWAIHSENKNITKKLGIGDRMDTTVQWQNL